MRCREDGSEYWAEAVITAIHSERGEVIGFAKVVRDLNERRRIEAALEQRSHELERANHAFESFSDSVAHDLREPLDRSPSSPKRWPRTTARCSSPARRATSTRSRQARGG